jgi:predicted DsbA family dithiol-disulfide isomerase
LTRAYDIEVEHCAFELHPGVPPEGQPVPWPPQRLAAARSQFEQAADAEGLPHVVRSHWYNSEPAHQASLWADDQSHGEEFRRAVYRAYFAQGANIGSTDVLVGLADELGLPAQELRAALDAGRYREQVAEQFERARELGVTAVPAYIAGRYVMVGAQPYELFQQLIETVQAEATTGQPGT